MFASIRNCSLRFWIDWRTLNEVKKPDLYPISPTDACIDSVKRAAVFSIVDANSCYWEVEVYKADRDKWLLHPIIDYTDFHVYRSVS